MLTKAALYNRRKLPYYWSPHASNAAQAHPAMN
jgi:hypothetical protein